MCTKSNYYICYYIGAMVCLAAIVVIIHVLTSCDRFNQMALEDANDMTIAGKQVVAQDLDEISLELKKEEKKSEDKIKKNEKKVSKEKN
jgi:hypothetical protein